MIVSQQKRVLYSQNGNLQKMDILRTIRKKDAPPSYLQPAQKQLPAIEHPSFKQSQKTSLLECYLVLVVAICVVVLLSGCFKIFTKTQKQSQNVQLFQQFPKILQGSEIDASSKQNDFLMNQHSNEQNLISKLKEWSNQNQNYSLKVFKEHLQMSQFQEDVFTKAIFDKMICKYQNSTFLCKLNFEQNKKQ